MPALQIQEVPQAVPAQLLECQAEPLKPAADLAGGELSDVQVAELLSDLAFAGRDCRDKLAQVRTLIKPTK